MRTDGHRRADRHEEANSRFSQFCPKRLKITAISREFVAQPYLNALHSFIRLQNGKNRRCFWSARRCLFHGTFRRGSATQKAVWWACVDYCDFDFKP